MSEPVHVLVVTADGLLWALPVDNVDQTLELAGRSVHGVGGLPMVVFRDVGTRGDRRRRRASGAGRRPTAARP